MRHWQVQKWQWPEVNVLYWRNDSQCDTDRLRNGSGQKWVFDIEEVTVNETLTGSGMTVARSECLILKKWQSLRHWQVKKWQWPKMSVLFWRSDSQWDTGSVRYRNGSGQKWLFDIEEVAVNETLTGSGMAVAKSEFWCWRSGSQWDIDRFRNGSGQKWLFDIEEVTVNEALTDSEIAVAKRKCLVLKKWQSMRHWHIKKWQWLKVSV